MTLFTPLIETIEKECGECEGGSKAILKFGVLERNMQVYLEAEKIVQDACVYVLYAKC